MLCNASVEFLLQIEWQIIQSRFELKWFRPLPICAEWWNGRRMIVIQPKIIVANQNKNLK